jgi:ethanolamine permease
LVWVPPVFDFSKYALNIGVDLSTGAAVELPEGNGPFLPFGGYGILASLPFAVWLFLAIEQLPLAAEKSVDPRRDMPKGIMLGMFILIARVPCSRLQPGHPDRTRNH